MGVGTVLRRQGVRDPMNFLAGDGEMATRIRNFDWAAHPFGPVADWPQSLRSALGICLNSAFPTAIYWGPELRLLYNDAWAPIPGPRHPAALGAPAREVWSDIWHVIEPQFIALIETGKGVSFENQLLPMRRYGFEEETYWTYGFTPIRGEDGGIVGVFNSGTETTDIVLARRESQFLLGLGDRLRELGSREEVLDMVLSSLGEHLRVARVGLRECDAVDGDLSLAGVWTAPGVNPEGRVLSFDELGPEIGRMMRAGETLRLDTTDVPAGAALKAVGWGATVAVPWRERGELVSILFMHQTEPHHWKRSEVSAATQALESMMTWFEKLDTAAREKVMMREIDHRARNLLAVMRSIVRLASAGDAEDLRDKILDRMAALSSTHNLLSERHWANLSVRQLLAQELEPYTGGDMSRVAFSGPRVALGPDTAQLVAMVFHELATNAAKHGALGHPEGRLEVRWSQDATGVMTLAWQENGTPRPEPAPVRKGFGSTLLSQVVEGQLGGRIEYGVGPDGFRCELVAQVAEGARGRAGSAGEKSVLIVEDEAIVALDLAETVRSLGYHVFASASDVDSGLAALSGASPAIAILDANLGGQSSQPIASVLAERGVPFIVVTGYGSGGLADAFADCTRMTKPIHDADLARVLSQAVGGGAAQAG